MRKLLPAVKHNKDAVSLFAAFVFLFNPGVLWYFSNGYMHEVLVFPFLLGVFSLFIDFVKEEKINKSKLLLYALLIITGIFCDWVSLFFSGMAFLYACLMWRKNKKWASFIFITIISSAVGIGITIWPFVLHIGWQHYFNALLVRFDERGISGGSTGAALHHLVKIVVNYLTSYASVFLGMLVLYLLNFKKWRFKIADALKQMPVALTIMIVVIVFHHFIFPEFSSRHEYSVLKASVVWAILFALMIQNISVKKMYLVVLSFFVSSLLQFYYINPPGKISWNGDRYDVSKRTGEFIRANAQKDEVVFVNDNDMYTQMNYYAKRITLNALSLKEAKSLLLSQTNAAKGVWFDIRQGELKGIYRFTRP
jgi:hypothetical protein